MSSIRTDNNTASALWSVETSKVEKIPPTIVCHKVQTAKMYGKRIRAVLGHNDFNINYNNKDSRICVKKRNRSTNNSERPNIETNV